MRKSVELKRMIDECKTQIENLKKDKKYEDALRETEKLVTLSKDYKTALTDEAEEEKGAKNMATIVSTDNQLKLKNRVFNKLVFGRDLTEEEKEIVNAGLIEETDTKGGYAVPVEQNRTILEYRDYYVQLKNYVNVETVNTLSGKRPTLGAEDGTLTNFEEMGEIKQSDFDFGQINYKVKSVGDIIPVSNQLLKDNDVNLLGIIGKRFARKSVNTENKDIIDILKTASKTDGKDYKDLIKCLNVTLSPAYIADAKIFTNQDGFNLLDTATDTDNRPLMTPDIAEPSKQLFRGHEVVVVPNALLASEGGKAPFYVGSLADFIYFFDRQQIEVAVSDVAGFTRYATYIRAVQRYDVKKVDENAIKGVELPFLTTVREEESSSGKKASE